MWRNPLEAGQKFNKARSGELSWEEVGRNPLEAGQKFNEWFLDPPQSMIHVAIPLKRGKSSTGNVTGAALGSGVAIPLKRGKSST